MSEQDAEAWNLRLKITCFKELSLVSLCTHAFTMLSASLQGGVSPQGPRWAMVTHPTNLRLGFQPELHVNVKEEKRRPSPGIPKPCGGELGCIPENAGRSEDGKTGNELHMFNSTWFTYNPSHSFEKLGASQNEWYLYDSNYT